MPIYEIQCVTVGCGKKIEVYHRHMHAEDIACPICNGPTERLYSLAAVSIFNSFDTRHIHPDGKNIHIGRRSDLTSACHEFGVVPATDVNPPKTKFNEIR
jgi:hypothetical protein